MGCFENGGHAKGLRRHARRADAPVVLQSAETEQGRSRDQNYITMVHDLDTKRLLFATEVGDPHQTVLTFTLA